MVAFEIFPGIPTLGAYCPFVVGCVTYPMPQYFLTVWPCRSSMDRWGLVDFVTALTNTVWRKCYSVAPGAGLLHVGQFPVGSLSLGTCPLGIFSWHVRRLATLKPPGWRKLTDRPHRDRGCWGCPSVPASSYLSFPFRQSLLWDDPSFNYCLIATS